MVVCELLACTKPNWPETFTALWNPYRKASLRGRHAQISFSQGACDETQKMTVCHFGFTEKVYKLPFSTSPQKHNTSLAEGGLPLLVFVRILLWYIWVLDSSLNNVFGIQILETNNLNFSIRMYKHTHVHPTLMCVCMCVYTYVHMYTCVADITHWCR